MHNINKINFILFDHLNKVRKNTLQNPTSFKD